MATEICKHIIDIIKQKALFVVCLALPTLEFRIVVHVRLFFGGFFSPLYFLIKNCMVIFSEVWPMMDFLLHCT